MTILNISNAIKEWVYFLRNADIFTISQRSVTTTTATGTWTGATSHLINATNIKNIRSITVGAVTLSYVTDYLYDIDYSDSGVIKCRITFTAAQTGSYVITYDYGTDRIFPDFPKSDLNLTHFPRIGCGIVNVPTDPAGFGGVNVSKIGITTIVYDKTMSDLNTYITAIRTAVFNAKSSFHYIGKLVQIRAVGPILKSPREQGKDKILQQNIDVEGWYNYEK